MEQKLDTKGIDGLRGMAALGIGICAHYYFWLPEQNYPLCNSLTYWFWFHAGYLVDLFFVISGFVMALSYRDRISRGKVQFVPYARRRLERFYPLMVVTLILTLILQLIHQHFAGLFFMNDIIFENNVLSFVLNLLCLQGTSLVTSSFNAPSWYLSTIFILYIVFYLVTYVAGKKHMENIAYAAMVLFGIAIGIKGFPTVFLNSRGVIGFFMGCLLYAFCEYLQTLEKSRRNLWLWSAFAVLMILLGMGICSGHKYFAPYNQIIIVYELVIWPALVLLAILAKPLREVLKLKIFQFLGKISFSMYLIHFPVMIALETANVAFHLNLNYAAKKVLLLYIVFVFIATILCYYLVEKPLDHLVRNWENQWRDKK